MIPLGATMATPNVNHVADDLIPRDLKCRRFVTFPDVADLTRLWGVLRETAI